MKVLLLGDIANRWAVSVDRVQELVVLDPIFQGPISYCHRKMLYI